MKVVDRYWSAICWDCQHLLSFSAYEYFQWVEVGRNKWQRRRPIEELLFFFDTLMNIGGTMTNEAVLEDPETIEYMGNQSDKDDGPRKVRLFGHTEEISLLKTLIELKIGKELPRPKIPGLELRLQKKITKTNDAVAAAQERARKTQLRKEKRAQREAAMRNRT